MTAACLLADEPTGALDSVNGEIVMRLVRAACKRGVAGVVVTHDAQLASWADRVVFLRDGRIVDQSMPARRTGVVAVGFDRPMSSHPNGGMPARGAVRQVVVAAVPSRLATAPADRDPAHRRRWPPRSGSRLRPTTSRRPSGDAQFGDATHFFRFDNNDPVALQAKLDAGAEWFGTIDAIGHRAVPVPGTEQTVDYRSQDPDGPFGGPMLRLRSGRYPTADTEAAVTTSVAELVGTEVGATIDLDGVERTVVGIVENPNDLDDDFVLLAPSELAQSESVAMLVHADDERVNSFRPPGANGRTVSARGDVGEDVMAAVLVLVVTTLALFLVGSDRRRQLHRHRPTPAAPARHDVGGRGHREAPSIDDAGERCRDRRGRRRSSGP